MSIQEVVTKLSKRLNYPSWLSAIGIGKKENEDCIYVYTVRKPRKNELKIIEEEVGTIPYVIRVTGKFRLE